MNIRPVKISVIIPIYNVEKYLSMCLTSCINQTLYDVEFICINDGSTDGSREILQQFADIDERIIIIDQENQGISAARNAGLDIASGEFIMFLDADDFIEETACERVWCETLEAPTDIVNFGSYLFPDNPYPTEWHFSVLNTPTKRFWEFSADVLFEEKTARPFLWHQAFKKSILDEYNIRFNVGVTLGEDLIFLFKFYPHAEYFAFIQDKLYNYRWYRVGSTMHTVLQDMDSKIMKDIDTAEIICEYWKNNGWFEDYGVEFLQWLLEFVVHSIRSKGVKKSSALYKRLKELIEEYNLDKYSEELSSTHKKLYSKL